MTSVIKNNDYINHLMHDNVGEIKPIRIEKFISALDATFGEEIRRNCLGYLYTTGDSVYSGMSDFKERLTNCFTDQNKISVEDQRYIADVSFRLFHHIIKLPS